MRLVTASLILAAAAIPSTSAFADRVFDGALMYTAQSNCTKTNGMFARTSQFYPRIVGNSKNITSLTELDQKSGAAYTLDGADFTTSFKRVTAAYIWYDSVVTIAKVRIISQVPSTITATTRFLTLTGQIESPYGDPGVVPNPCIVTFKASYVGVTR